MVSALKGVMSNNGYVLLMTRGLHHVERGARHMSTRRVTCVDCDYQDKRCTKKCEDEFSLEQKTRAR